MTQVGTNAKAAVYLEDSLSGDLGRKLLDYASTDLYQKNGFRTLECGVDASPAEIDKRRRTIERALAHEGLAVPKGKGRALPLDAPIDAATAIQAAQRLGDPSWRLMDEFFWFWPAGGADEAITALSNDKVKDAEARWLEQSDEPGERTIARHNLAVLYHLRALEGERSGSIDGAEQDRRWTKTYKRWAEIEVDEPFWHQLAVRISDLDDPRLGPGIVAKVHQDWQIVLSSIHAKLIVAALEAGRKGDADRLLRSLEISGLDDSKIDSGIREALAPIRAHVTAICRSAEAAIEQDPVHGDEICVRLIEEGQAAMSILAHLRSENDPLLTATGDELAERLRLCQIGYCKKTCDWKQAITFLEAAHRFARTSTVVDLMAKEIDIVKDNLKRNDDYCEPSYYSLDPEIRDRLEHARTFLATKDYDRAIQLLSDLLKSEGALIAKHKALPHVARALAFCLGFRAFDNRNRAIVEYNHASEKHRNDLIDRIIARKSEIDSTSWAFAQSGISNPYANYYCMVCARKITGTYFRVNHTYSDGSPCKLLYCDQHSGPPDKAVNQAIVQAAQEFADAFFLHPENTFIADQHDKTKRECHTNNLATPTVSAWLTAAVNPLRKKQPKAEAPSAKTADKAPTEKPGAPSWLAWVGIVAIILIVLILIALVAIPAQGGSSPRHGARMSPGEKALVQATPRSLRGMTA